MDKYLPGKPMLMKPAFKDYLWGGRRLNDEFSKDIDSDIVAETWECSTHSDGPSIIDSGEFRGMSLTQFLEIFPECLGTHPRKTNPDSLPILIKFIDAKKDLSVQVHPDDMYAKTHENGQLGKTEMWYVLSATKKAELVYGFHHDMEKEEVRKHLQDGTIENYLQKVPIKKDDVFLINSGTVHAIGAGALVAEIQENSNLTYRLYDYNRVGKDGKKRELHIDKALDVADLKAADNPRQPMRVLKYRRGWASELLMRCKYFQTERIILNTETTHQMVDFKTDGTSFQVFLCLSGCGSIIGEDFNLSMFKGDCIFIPSDSVRFKLHGNAQLLKVSC